jgi:hypothetical protein
MVNEAQSSNRTRIIVLATGALLAALLVVVIFAFIVLEGDGDSGEGVTVESAKLMPADTFMHASFNPNLDQVKNFEVIDRAWGDNPLIKEGLTEMLDSMKVEGLDYKAEIEPWLGDEVAFSMGGDIAAMMVETPLGGASPAVPEFIVAIATKDKAASDKFLDRMRVDAEQDGTEWQETEYEGVKIAYSEPEYEWDTGVAYATVDNLIILTTGDLEAMKAAIDARDGDNLAGNQNYKDVLAKLPADQIGYGYMDMGVYMDAVLDAAGPELADLPPELFNLDMLEAFKGAGFSVGFEPNGLRIDYVVVYDQDALGESVLGTQASPNQAVGRVPASTLFYLSASGLGNVLQAGLDTIKAMPDQPPDLEEQMQMLTAMLGVSVEDLIEMLSGEFALAVTHDPAGIAGDPSVPVGASFLIEAKDQGKFETLLRSLSGLLTLGAEMELPTQTINDVEVTVVQDPFTESMIVGWGVGKGFFALGTSQELLEAAFGGGPKLADDATYKAATAPLPKEKSGIFYVNVEGLLKIVVEAMGPWERESFDKEGRALLEPIKAISAAAEPLDKNKDSMSGTLFILIESE